MLDDALAGSLATEIYYSGGGEFRSPGDLSFFLQHHLKHKLCFVLFLFVLVWFFFCLMEPDNL